MSQTNKFTACRACNQPFNSSVPRQEFCGPACCKQWRRLKNPYIKKSQDAKEISNRLAARRWHLLQLKTRKNIFNFLSYKKKLLQQEIKEMGEREKV